MTPNRIIYLAISEEAFSNIFDGALGEVFLESNRLRLIIFDMHKEDILKWIK